MKRFFTFLLLSFFTISCVYNHTNDIKELGKGYYLLEDGKETQILFSPNEKRNFGINVTGSEVVQYNFDANYIIAKSIENDIEKYWVINKNLTVEKIISFSKKEFEKEIINRNIDLVLKNRD